MMGGLDDEPKNATPLTPGEREGLIPSHISLRGELNELEQQNILAADRWAFARKRNPFSENFLLGLHRRMFGKVWRWAGKYRTTERNFGVATYRIQSELHRVLDDAAYWIGHNTYPPDEIAVRLHHGLVCVHPFANGNGRWSRLAADLAAVHLGQSRFTWGRSALRAADETRANYIAALHTADNHDLELLIGFARS